MHQGTGVSHRENNAEKSMPCHLQAMRQDLLPLFDSKEEELGTSQLLSELKHASKGMNNSNERRITAEPVIMSMFRNGFSDDTTAASFTSRTTPSMNITPAVSDNIVGTMIVNNNNNTNNISSSNCNSCSTDNEGAVVRRSVAENVALSVLVATILLLALAGNLLVIACVRLRRQLREDKGNLLIVNLSVTDMLSATVVMGSSLHALAADHWPLGSVWCDMVCGANYTLIIVSMLTLCFVSLDRYMAIIHAMHYHVRVTRKKIFILIAYAWVQGFTFGLAPIAARWIKYDYWEMVCAIEWHADNHRTLLYVIVAFALCFLIPGIVLVVAYTKVMKVANKINNNNPAPQPRIRAGPRSPTTTTTTSTGASINNATDIAPSQRHLIQCHAALPRQPPPSNVKNENRHGHSADLLPSAVGPNELTPDRIVAIGRVATALSVDLLDYKRAQLAYAQCINGQPYRKLDVKTEILPVLQLPNTLAEGTDVCTVNPVRHEMVKSLATSVSSTTTRRTESRGVVMSSLISQPLSPSKHVINRSSSLTLSRSHGRRTGHCQEDDEDIFSLRITTRRSSDSDMDCRRFVSVDAADVNYTLSRQEEAESSSQKKQSFSRLAYSTDEYSEKDTGKTEKERPRVLKGVTPNVARRRTDSANSKTMRSLLIVVLGYFICMTPFSITKLYKVLVPSPDALPGYVNVVATVVQYCSSAINPLIYGIFRKDFQLAFRLLFRHFLGRTTFRNKSPGDANGLSF